ncbi:MAG: TPMT family class I SAM-dependent methyltransferase [Bacteroidales bacterium]|nr:TPMT family class I SAM-dependent methyltransferase [Bacteroidales bacterium]
MKINQEYWNNLYKNKTLGWDIGYISPPLKEYFNQIADKNLKILIPGGGSGYEAKYLYKNGFINTFYLDYSELAINNFKTDHPDFPDTQIINQDFFEHCNKYDLIIELAFFTSVEPENRKKLANKMYELLNTGGKYVGLFFNHEFKLNKPPYGAIKETYLELIKDLFDVKTFEIAHNSIKPRKGRELFFIFEKK